MDIRKAIESYIPWDEKEAGDREMLLEALSSKQGVFTRNNRFAHFTASAWIVNPHRDRVLMAWHNIYKAWSWTGGHADGDTDLLRVALREAREETGIEIIRPLLEDVYSLEVLPVNGHFKRGKYVSTHLHLNVTYLFEADDAQIIVPKPDENSAVAWRTLEQSQCVPEEPFMEKIYTKLNEKLPRL